MAGELLTWARKQVFPQLKPSGAERFILFLLADNCSWNEEDERWYAFPYLATLVEDSGYSKSTVQRALSKFIDLGVISTERWYRKSGAAGGNAYILHPEVVENPVAKVSRKAKQSRVVTMTTPETSRVVSMTSQENGAVDNLHGPQEFNSGHSDYSRARVVTTTPSSGHSDQSRTRVSFTAHPSLTPNEPSSSSMSPSATTDSGVASAGAEADKTTMRKEFWRNNNEPITRWGIHHVSGSGRPVSLDRVAEDIAGQWSVTLDRDRLAWLVEEIVSRSARTVGAPEQFVRKSLVNDGADWEQALQTHFGDSTTDGRSPGHGTTGDRKCPIQHHADSGWNARTCPGCRKQLDFPKQLDRATYEALDAQVRSLVDRDQTVTVVDMTGPSVRARDQHAG